MNTVLEIIRQKLIELEESGFVDGFETSVMTKVYGELISQGFAKEASDFWTWMNTGYDKTAKEQIFGGDDELFALYQKVSSHARIMSRFCMPGWGIYGT